MEKVKFRDLLSRGDMTYALRTTLFLIFAIFVCYLQCSVTVFADSGNLLGNGSFENGLAPAVGYGSTISESESYYRNGCHSCKVTQAGNYGALYVPVAMQNGKTYSYSAWVRYDPNSPAGQGICLAFIASNGAVQTVLATSPTLNKMDDWTKITGTFQMQQDLQNQFLSFYVNPGNGLQTFYVDNMELKEIVAP